MKFKNWKQFIRKAPKHGHTWINNAICATFFFRCPLLLLSRDPSSSGVGEGGLEVRRRQWTAGVTRLQPYNYHGLCKMMRLARSQEIFDLYSSTDIHTCTALPVASVARRF